MYLHGPPADEAFKPGYHFLSGKGREAGRSSGIPDRGNGHTGGLCIGRGKKAAQWAFDNNRHAGATTRILSHASCLYLAVRINDAVYGVVGIVIKKDPLAMFENSILLSILGECALRLKMKKCMGEAGGCRPGKKRAASLPAFKGYFP